MSLSQFTDAMAHLAHKGRPVGSGYHHLNLSLRIPCRGYRTLRYDTVKVRRRVPAIDLVERVWENEGQLLQLLRSWPGGLPVGVPLLLHHSHDGVSVHSYVPGTSLADRYPEGSRLPTRVVDQILQLFAVLTAVVPTRLPKPSGGRTFAVDSSAFLRARVVFAQRTLADQNSERFGGLFASLGVDPWAMESFGARLPELTDRPFALLHTDLHRGNVIEGRSARITVLDWEHACYGDPLYELATHLCRTRYPKQQESEVIRRWEEAVGQRSPAGVEGLAEDLRHFIDYERAQSFYPNTIRAALAYSADPTPRTLAAGGRWLHRTLREAADPLRLKRVSSEEECRAELLRWYEGDGRAG
ncbi:aminoglycoside phosphotransferase family protein [Streptacidiphilus sp. N1-10]|uniref:Aminoglycoside phosphotransferase family protein n=1 Tax=Streptacidiphilus jeojiensis TaxID=3229225 RepID=A0ABV6XVM4_9ACTN